MGALSLVRTGRSALVAGVGVLLVAGCTPDFRLVDGLTKTSDITRFLAAQAVDELSAGSPILGDGGGINAPGVASADLKVSRVSREIPRLDGITLREDGSAATRFATDKHSAVTVGFDAALGIWKGLPLGETRTLAIEAIGSLVLLPDYPDNTIDLRRDARVSFGIGTRIGLIAETRNLPGISVGTVLRSQPKFAFTTAAIPTTTGGEGRLSMTIGDPNTVYSWRLALVKHVGMVAITAGYGRDNYSADADRTVSLTGATNISESWSDYSSAERRTLFVGGAYQFWRDAAIGAELVHTSSTINRELRNSFGDHDGWSQTFLTAGVRLGRR